MYQRSEVIGGGIHRGASRLIEENINLTSQILPEHLRAHEAILHSKTSPFRPPSIMPLNKRKVNEGD